MGAFGHALLKPSYLYNNLPTVDMLHRTRPDGFKQSKDRDAVYKKSISGRVSGGQSLPGSAEYTVQYCEAVHKAWQRVAAFTLP